MTYHKNQIKVHVDRRKDGLVTATIKLIAFQPGDLTSLGELNLPNIIRDRLIRALVQEVYGIYRPPANKPLPDNIIGGK